MKNKPGRPMTRLIKPIPATPEEVVRAIYAGRTTRPPSRRLQSASSTATASPQGRVRASSSDR